MTDTHYSSSFLITTGIYTLIGLLYLSFTDEIEPIKKSKPKPQVVRIALIAPVTTKAQEKVKKVEPKKPKPKPKKIIKKKKIVKKKKIIKKKIIKKRIATKKPPPPKKEIPKEIPKKIVPPPMPITEVFIPEPIIEPIIEPIYEPIYEPPPPVVYTQVPPQEIYYEQAPAPIVTTKPQIAQQQYIIHDPIEAPQAVIAPAPPVNYAVKSDLSNEKRAFKHETRNIINSNKHYPKMAQRRHIQGSVRVTFDILSNGNIFNIRTSGASTILQKAARKSVMKSSPLTVPSILQSQFPMNNVSVNIDFQL